MSSDENCLTSESRASLEFWTKLQAQNRPLLEECGKLHLDLVNLLESVQKEWRRAVAANARNQELVEHLKRQNENYASALNKANEENRQLQSEQAADQRQIRSLQEELEQYKTRFHAARTEIQNASFAMPPSRKAKIGNNVEEEGEEEDIPFIDQPEEEAEAGRDGRTNRNGKRRSASVVRLPEKRAKMPFLLDFHEQDDQRTMTNPEQRSGISSFATTEDGRPNRRLCGTSTETDGSLLPPLTPGPGRVYQQTPIVDFLGPANPVTVGLTPLTTRNRGIPVRLLADSTISAKKRRSKSEPRSRNFKYHICQSANPATPKAKSRLPLAGFGNGWTRGRPLEECVHRFEQVNNLLSKCTACTKFVFARGLRCSDCKLNAHEACRAQVPFLCVPIVPTSRFADERHRPQLADFCPESQPRIPGQLIHCALGLESVYLHSSAKSVSLYKVPNTDLKELKRLEDCFNSKCLPRMDSFDAVTLVGFIRKFLTELREPLIPYSSFQEFSKAAGKGDELQLKGAIETLPIPNRDSLAFLCAHWQKVVVHSREKFHQTSLEAMANTMGPVIACSTRKAEPKQTAVHILSVLLKLEQSYWAQFLNPPPLPLTASSRLPQPSATARSSAYKGGGQASAVMPLLSFDPTPGSSSGPSTSQQQSTNPVPSWTMKPIGEHQQLVQRCAKQKCLGKLY